MAEFSEIRALLSEKPSVGTWRQLCEMIDTFPLDERNEIAIPYCRQHLEMTPSWTAQNRRAPQEWVRAFLEGYDVMGQLSLVSHIDFVNAVEKRQEILDFVTDISPFVLLRVIKLDGLQLHDEHAARLAQAEHFSQLTALHLSHNEIGSMGAQALALSEHFSQVQNLDLSHNSILDSGAIAIANSPHLHKLQFLNLEGCSIGEEGAAAIANAEHLPASIKRSWSREAFEKAEDLQKTKADWRGGKRKTPGYRW